jgi:hypothetical protein
MRTFPDFPALTSTDEYAYALGNLEQAVRSLHDRLEGISACSGLCEDLRQLPAAMARALETRRHERMDDGAR